MPESDDVLLKPGEKVSSRDTFSRIFRRYYSPLVRYAQGITGDEASAADAVQDVFLGLWQRRDTLTVDASLQGLLYTMTRNRALNMNRKRRRIAPDADVTEVLDARDAAPAGERSLEAGDLADLLRRWIDALSPRRREAFVLSRYHDLTHAEIADVMGLSVRTVDTHIVHALKELRGRLRALEEDERSRS